MKLWKKIAFYIIFALIPAPDIEVSIKIDIDRDDKPDLVVSYRDFKFSVTGEG